MTGVTRGTAALHDFLAKQLFDLRELDVERFPAWLDRHLSGWRKDAVFLQRVRIRDLRRANPELSALEAERQRARAAYESSPHHSAIEAAAKELAGAENAVAGLTHALSRAEAQERERLSMKLESFRRRVVGLKADVRDLTRESSEWTALRGIEERLAQLREEVGFDREVAKLNKLQRQQGRSSGRSGASFERVAEEAVRAAVLPELEGAAAAGSAVILRGVTLGAARLEIDQLIVLPGLHENDPVEVLALLESKRNPNDLAHGLRRRLDNLAWLAGHRPGYDAGAQRTGTYTTGHFDVVAAHTQGGSRYRISIDSFRRFLPDLAAGDLPRGLYLVTRSGPLWGIGSGGLARIAHRVASDVAWDPEDTTYLAALLGWCQDLAHEVEAPDVLRRHATDPEAAHRVLILSD